MSIFKHLRRKKTAERKSTSTVSLFRGWPDSELSPVPYMPYTPLFNDLRSTLDSYLDELFKGEIDDANGDVLDSIITDHVRQAMNDLADQRAAHIDCIHTLLLNDSNTRCKLEQELLRLQDKHETHKAIYDDLCARQERKKWRNESC